MQLIEFEPANRDVLVKTKLTTTNNKWTEKSLVMRDTW